MATPSLYPEGVATPSLYPEGVATPSLYPDGGGDTLALPGGDGNILALPGGWVQGCNEAYHHAPVRLGKAIAASLVYSVTQT